MKNTCFLHDRAGTMHGRFAPTDLSPIPHWTEMCVMCFRVNAEHSLIISVLLCFDVSILVTGCEVCGFVLFTCRCDFAHTCFQEIGS